MTGEKGKVMKNKKSIYNVATSLAYKIGTCIIGLIVPRLFVMSYGSELNGLQSSISQIFAYIALIEAGVGEATLQALFGPIAKKEYKRANEILSATTFYYNKIGFIYFGLLVALALLYPVFIKVDSISYITVVVYILFSGATTGINFFYQAKILLIIQATGDVYLNSLVTLVTYIFTSIVKIGCIIAGLNIVMIQIGYFIINTVMIFVYYQIARRKYNWVSFKEKPDYSAISQKNSVLFHKVSGIIFQNVDIIILTVLCGLKVVSIYTMYKLVINMITTIIASFSDSFNYIFGQTFNSKSREEYCQVIDTFNVFYSAVAFALFTVTNIMILPFLKLYTDGMDINYILPVLPYLYIVIEVLQVGREAMLRTITVAGHFSKTLYSTIAETTINLSVSIIAVLICKKMWGNEAGLYGALIGTIAALLFRTFDINIYANKKILNRSSWKTNKVMVVNGCVFLIVIYFINKIKIEISTYKQFVCWGIPITILIIGTYLIVQMMFNSKETKNIYLLFKNKRK